MHIYRQHRVAACVGGRRDAGAYHPAGRRWGASGSGFGASLTFALTAATDAGDPADVEVVLTTADGVEAALPLAQFAPLPRPLPTQQVKSETLARWFHLEWSPKLPVERVYSRASTCR